MIEESTVRIHVKRVLGQARLRDRVHAVICADETLVNRTAAGCLRFGATVNEV